MPLPAEAVLQAYVAVWSENDAARREALLLQCWSERSEIIGPGYYFRGQRAVLAEIERFQRQEPDLRVALTSGIDIHTNWARFTIALVNLEGALVNEGWDVVEFAEDGRIARVVTFWGALPPALRPGLQGLPEHSRAGDA